MERFLRFLSVAIFVTAVVFILPARADDLCRNLFDSTKVSVGYVNSGNGTVAGAETYSASDFIPVVVGQKYYLGGNHFGGPNTGAFYKSDKTYLSGITANGIINVPQDAAYIRFTILTTALGTAQFERGSTATAYQPYNPLCATCDGTVAVENGESRCIPPIKIATNAYNDAQFAPVESALNSAVSTIKNVVANTIAQTAAIAEIASDKQTRPDSGCPAGKTCLLVEDMNGDPHWYEIIEEYIPPEPPEPEPTPASP